MTIRPKVHVLDAATIRAIVGGAVRRSLRGSRVDEAEIEFFTRGFRSAIALQAVNIALANKAQRVESNVESFHWRADGSIDELPRNELIAHLENASGLPSAACEAALDAVSNTILTEVSSGDEVELTGIGTVHSTHEGAVLQLDADLAVRSPLAGRPKGKHAVA